MPGPRATRRLPARRSPFQFRPIAPTSCSCPRTRNHDRRNKGIARSAPSRPSSGSGHSAQGDAPISISIAGCPASMPCPPSRRRAIPAANRPRASPRTGAGDWTRFRNAFGKAATGLRRRSDGFLCGTNGEGLGRHAVPWPPWPGRASLAGRSGLSIARRAGSGRAQADRQAARKRRLFLCPISGMKCPNAPTFPRS